MLKNYLLVIFRSLKKNFSYTLINIVGLGIGISATIMTILLFEYEFSFDSKLKNVENIYRINSVRQIEQENQKWGTTPLAMGPELKDQIPEIESYCRYARTNLILKHEDNTHHETIFFADSLFFNWYDYKVLKGTIHQFEDPNTMIIDENIAKKYFGDDDPIGKMFSIYLNNTMVATVQVGAVIENVPMNSSFQFRIILPIHQLHQIYELDETAWDISIPLITYLKIRPGATTKLIEDRLDQLITKHNELHKNWQVSEFMLMPFKKQRNESRELNMSITWPGLPLSALYGSLFMNSILLLISCINFVNTSLAYARRRLKEIGIRKTFGGIKKQIFFQFMIENLIQCIAAFLAGILLANYWISWMNAQWPVNIDPNYFGNPIVVLFLLLLIITVTFVSGAYPALYVAGFEPFSILKGNITIKGNTSLSRILLVWQFTFSITAIFSGIVLMQNARYQRNLDWGYDKDHVIVVPVQDEKNLVPFKNALTLNPDLESLAASVHNVGYTYENIPFTLNGVAHDAQSLKVGNGYIQTLGINLIAGRDFENDSENDVNESIIVNKQFLTSFKIENPLKTSLIIENRRYYIIGVIDDFMPYGLQEPIKAVMLRKITDDQCVLLSLSVPHRDLVVAYEKVQETWKKLFPTLPFSGFYQSDSYQAATYVNEGIFKQFSLMAFFGLFLSVTGLFAMVSLNINRRLKEIGIRKVLGASLAQIMILINREFVVILIIASILGSILGYYFMQLFLGNIYDYHITIGPGMFILSTLIIFFSALITSGKKIIAAALSNPTESLRCE